jgi:mRNA-degrading endonuclease RelE of RelBE toxin-antitoxin system
MAWTVTLHRKVDKELQSLPAAVRKHLFRLIYEIELFGPVRGDWLNYGKLGKKQHHCHIKRGKPTYVAVWKEMDGEIQLVEVTYAGTHENAPY